MFALVLAGGTIYALPYLRQGYANAMRQAFSIDQTELGFLNTSFGILALACYFPGGWVADRFSPRRLITFSLLTTGLTGFVFATLPPYPVVLALHAFWGVSSILTFWAALIRATRGWGSADEQGRAFGYLDGGRGVVEGTTGVLTVLAFGSFASSVAGLQAVIVVFAGATVVAAIVAWFVIPEGSPIPSDAREKILGTQQVKAVLRLPVVWLQAAVILCAYCGYWGTFNLAGFATDAFDASEVYGATLATFRQWCRPVAAIFAGVIADRIGASRTVAIGFCMLILGYVGLAAVPTQQSLLWVLWVDTAIVALAVFALRGVYFALLQEGGVPVMLTGTAVGLVSVVGFTPDIFLPLLVGSVLDAYPGAEGHQLYFGALAAVSGLGLLATLMVPRFAPEPGAGVPLGAEA